MPIVRDRKHMANAIYLSANKCIGDFYFYASK